MDKLKKLVGSLAVHRGHEGAVYARSHGVADCRDREEAIAWNLDRHLRELPMPLVHSFSLIFISPSGFY